MIYLTDVEANIVTVDQRVSCVGHLDHRHHGCYQKEDEVSQVGDRSAQYRHQEV